MAAFVAVNELFAICTCWLMASLSSRANFLSSASADGVKGLEQRARILAVMFSIRASVEDGTRGILDRIPTVFDTVHTRETHRFDRPCAQVWVRGSCSRGTS